MTDNIINALKITRMVKLVASFNIILLSYSYRFITVFRRFIKNLFTINYSLIRVSGNTFFCWYNYDKQNKINKCKIYYDNNSNFRL